MKKLILMITVATMCVIFTSCGTGISNKTTNDSTLVVSVDSVQVDSLSIDSIKTL